VIVVTGASRGLGQAICERLVSNGHEVTGLARTASDAGPVPILACDVSSADAVKQVARTIKADGKPVTGLINAAGIAAMNLALTTPPALASTIIATNLLGTIYCCQAFAPLLIRQKGGAIINFSTIAVHLGLKGESIYVASKAGVEGFSRAFAREMADFGINVNCIAPGPIDTDLLRGISDKQIDRILRQQIFNKQFAPEDVCDLVDVLLDKKSAALSGQVLHVGGV
jgi:3-oxoacyl-[acyl-carrier protein] reductase